MAAANLWLDSDRSGRPVVLTENLEPKPVFTEPERPPRVNVAEVIYLTFPAPVRYLSIGEQQVLARALRRSVKLIYKASPSR